MNVYFRFYFNGKDIKEIRQMFFRYVGGELYFIGVLGRYWNVICKQDLQRVQSQRDVVEWRVRVYILVLVFCFGVVLENFVSYEFYFLYLYNEMMKIMFSNQTWNVICFENGQFFCLGFFCARGLECKINQDFFFIVSFGFKDLGSQRQQILKKCLFVNKIYCSLFYG